MIWTGTGTDVDCHEGNWYRERCLSGNDTEKESRRRSINRVTVINRPTLTIADQPKLNGNIRYLARLGMAHGKFSSGIKLDIGIEDGQRNEQHNGHKTE